MSNIESIKSQLGEDSHSRHIGRENNKRVLDREEKKLGKIADKNTSVIRSIKTKALRRKYE